MVAQKLTDPMTVALIASATQIAATLIEVAHRERRLNRFFALGLGAPVLGGAVATNAVAPAALGLGVAAAVREFPDLSPIGRSTVTLGGGLFPRVLCRLLWFSWALTCYLQRARMARPLGCC
ncbi:MAG: hypothetical protein GDA40_10190 [Rhodobacteraceae bacterium]|nr:hypothetical protein [Paracoccaceae bacterium]